VTPRLPNIRALELIRLLERKGFRVVRQSGSHAILRHADGRRTTIPIHSSKTVGKGLLQHIMKDTELTVNELIDR
jgi:predicted RNA binding protein YcfA (HicA-like mRNA interferase family)